MQGGSAHPKGVLTLIARQFDDSRWTDCTDVGCVCVWTNWGCSHLVFSILIWLSEESSDLPDVSLWWVFMLANSGHFFYFVCIFATTKFPLAFCLNTFRWAWTELSIAPLLLKLVQVSDLNASEMPPIQLGREPGADLDYTECQAQARELLRILQEVETRLGRRATLLNLLPPCLKPEEENGWSDVCFVVTCPSSFESIVTAVNPNWRLLPSFKPYRCIFLVEYLREVVVHLIFGKVFWGRGFVWVPDPRQSAGPHSLLVFSLRQQSPYPVPVHQTGGGVEWDHRAASTNLFPSAAWLISPVGDQLLPASGMYPPQLSEEFFVRMLGFAQWWVVWLTGMGSIQIWCSW